MYEKRGPGWRHHQGRGPAAETARRPWVWDPKFPGFRVREALARRGRFAGLVHAASSGPTGLQAPAPRPGGGRGRPHLRGGAPGCHAPPRPRPGGPAHGPRRGAAGSRGGARRWGRGRVQRAEGAPEPAALRWAPGVQGEGPGGREDGGGVGGEGWAWRPAGPAGLATGPACGPLDAPCPIVGLPRLWRPRWGRPPPPCAGKQERGRGLGGGRGAPSDRRWEAGVRGAGPASQG